MKPIKSTKRSRSDASDVSKIETSDELVKRACKSDASDASDTTKKSMGRIREVTERVLEGVRNVRFVRSDFWKLCNYLPCNELQAELVSWGCVRSDADPKPTGFADCFAKIDAAMQAEDRETIGRCIGWLARRRVEAEPCYGFMADQRYGSTWRDFKALYAVESTDAPPEDQTVVITDDGYKTLPVTELDRYVLSAIANGETFALRPADFQPATGKE